MSPSKPLVANLYNPHEQSKEQLIESFVVNLNVFKKLFREIKTSKMKYPEQHFFIEGQRGTGKTTLLLRLNYEIEHDEALNSWLIPIVFKEEGYWGISNLAQLWETTAQILEDKDEAFSGLYEEMERTYDENQDYERICFETLVNALEKHAKKLILFIDNIGEMFQNFNDKESHRLREVLMTCPHLRVIGATSVVLEASFRYDHAFYEFFKKVSLEELNREDTHTLLLELAKANDEEEAIQDIIENQPGRVETLRILTGGVIRTIVLLFEVFTDDRYGNSIADLENVLDRVTPLYKHRMDDLASKQRTIVDTIALNWDAMSPEEIARKTRRKIDEITAIIGELEDLFIIQRAQTDTRVNLYYLRERFFNIWYLMRQAPKRNQTKVIWLVRFLENWYDPAELGQRAKRHIQAMASGDFHPKAAYYLTEALAETGQLDMETEHEMKMQARKLLRRKDKSLAADLSDSDKELAERAVEFEKNEDYEKALNRLLGIRNKNAHVNFGIGVFYGALRNYQKAVKYYLMAVEAGHTNASYNLGLLYANALQDYQNAEKYYLMAVEAGHTDAMNNLGNLYANALQDYQNAQAYLKMAVEAGHTDAMNNLGSLYKTAFNDDQKAEIYYKMAVKKGHASAMFNLGILYYEVRQDYQNAEKYYRMAVEKGYTDAMHNLAWLHFEQKQKKQETLKYAKQTVEADKRLNRMYVLACVYAWNNQIENSLQTAKGFISDPEYYKTWQEGEIIIYPMLLLAKERYADVAAYFETPELNLKERFKPLYYALLYFLKDKEYHKLPPELAKPVNEIIKEVEQMAVDYA